MTTLNTLPLIVQALGNSVSPTDGTITWGQLDPSTVNLTLGVAGHDSPYTWINGQEPATWTQTATVVNGQSTLTGVPIYANNTFSGNGQVSIPPGKSVSATVTVDPNSTVSYGGMWLSGNGYDTSRWTEYPGGYDGGIQYDTSGQLEATYNLFAVGQANVDGTVVDANGQPIANATVRLKRSTRYGIIPDAWAQWLSDPNYPDLQLTTGSDGTFSFQNVSFLEYELPNLELDVSATGYSQGTATTAAIWGTHWQKNITLFLTVSNATNNHGDL
jgi:hypothetical protein